MSSRVCLAQPSLARVASPSLVGGKRVSIHNFGNARAQLGRPRVATHAAEGEAPATPPAEGEAGAAAPRPKIQPKVMSRRPMPKRPPPGMMYGPDGNLLKVVKVEDAGSENPYAFEGVAQMDGGGAVFSFQKLATLVGGDLAALLLFAIIGRINHGEILDWETLSTAAPFMIGWVAAASALGGYSTAAQNADTKGAATTAAKCWAVGTPAGLVLRGVFKGYVPPKPFIIVSMVVTAVLLIGWRSAYASSTSDDSGAASGNRQGGVLEFFSLLGSLVRRW